MKPLLGILVSLIAVTAFGGSGDVTADLHLISTSGTHTNLTFLCEVILDNQTGAALAVPAFPAQRFALRVSDANGHELAKIYPWPMIFWSGYSEKQPFPLNPGGNPFELNYVKFKDSMPVGLSLSPGTRTVRLQADGILSGSNYTNRIVSNVVEVRAP